MKKHKNIGPFLAFDHAWFLHHQAILLWLLNAAVVGRWFKWVLCIRRCDVGHSNKILEILPHCYTVAGEAPGTLTTEFRTHPKYAKRIYYAFRPLWWSLHFWDWLIADRFFPALSFGFFILVVYPDPDPETYTVDGSLYRQPTPKEDFATITAGAGQGAGDSFGAGGVQLYAASNPDTNKYNYLYRQIYLFNTSSLIAAATIHDAVFSACCQDKDTSLYDDTVHVVSSAPSSNTSLTATDFTTLGSTSFAQSGVISTFTIDSYVDFTLNSSGRSNITKGGISKFGLMIGVDFLKSDAAYSWVATWGINFNVYLADAAGTSQDPKLTVNYSTAQGFLEPNQMRRWA